MSRSHFLKLSYPLLAGLVLASLCVAGCKAKELDKERDEWCQIQDAPPKVVPWVRGSGCTGGNIYEYWEDHGGGFSVELRVFKARSADPSDYTRYDENVHASWAFKGYHYLTEPGTEVVERTLLEMFEKQTTVGGPWVGIILERPEGSPLPG